MDKKWLMFSKGFKQDPKDDRDYKFTALPDEKRLFKMADALPPQINWREDLSSVKYQGELGSCVAFAVAALKEWQEGKEHQGEVEAGKLYRRNKEYDLSEQWIYWNAKKIDPWPGEEGTNFRSALKVLHKIGVPTEKGWPYSDDKLNIGKPKNWAHLVARWGTIDSYWSIEPYVDPLKRALVESPVLFGIPCFEEIFGELSNGVIPYPANRQEIWGYHAVLAVGYDDDTKQIAIKNSWSPFWGDGGYGYLSYDYINDFAEDFWMVKDHSVTIEMLKGAKTLIE